LTTAPSDEAILQAVERHISEHGTSVDLSAPGAARISWHSVFEFHVHRSIEKRYEQQGKAKGSDGKVATKPTYTDLEAYPVAPPADPQTSQRTSLVLQGTIDEELCGGCVGGRNQCGACKGRGRLPCPTHVECEACHGGPDTCWECDGTGTPRTRRRRSGTRDRGPDAPKRETCKRCRSRDVACPTCLGETATPCRECDKKGSLPCEECNGAKRVEHKRCGGTGRFTVWTEGIIAHTPDTDEVILPGPQFSWLKTASLGEWRRAELTGVTEKLPDFLQDAHRRLVAPHLPAKKHEVSRRMTFRHLPIARVEVVAHPHRVYYAFPAVTGIEVARRPSRDHVKALVWTAAALAALTTVVTLTVLR
jgi:hypothetical protein